MDTFGTATLRSRVLAAWAASPARFREDANAEEELVRGAYRDRLVVELAQNAADAAVRAGVPGRLLLRIDERTLTAANVGAPLDAASVEALSTLRASAKRDDDPAQTVGRFGVGFAAVLAVTDAPVMLSRSGGVRWSRSDTLGLVTGLPELAEELTRRGDAVPVLRLPFPAEGEIPEPYDTFVLLPLRDQPARVLARDQLDALDDALLLALPGLSEVIVEVGGTRRIVTAHRSGDDTVVLDAGRSTRWKLATRTGRTDPALLADRPVEERARPMWAVTVAVPVDDDGAPAPLPDSVPRVVHAPTPTDERTVLPAIVIATFPLDSARRRIVPGSLTDALVGEASHAYAELAAAVNGPGALDLVAGPLGAGQLDGALIRATVAELSATPLVPAADGAGRLRPTEVVLVTGLRTAADPAAAGRVVAGLPALPWWRPEPLRRLGAREIALADVVDRLAGLDLSAAEWGHIYAALDGADRDALAALPVPLADGRLVRGPREVLLPTDDVRPETLAALGLRVAAADAVHPLLGRLGALDATAAGVLASPALRAAVDDLADQEEPEPEQVGAVLSLVAASGLTAGDEPWLARLPLRDQTGKWAAAGELLVPDSPVLDLLDVDPAEQTVATDMLERWGRPVLLAVGVRDGFPVVHDADVPLDEDCWHDLDDEDRWVQAVAAELPRHDVPALLTDFTAVGHLDLVRTDAWPAALAVLAADPLTRPALVDPAYALLADGSRRTIPAYTVWWLRTHAELGGCPLGELCAADADAVVQALFDRLDVELDVAAERALGLPRSLAEVDPGLLLNRLADPSRALGASDLAGIYAALAVADLDTIDPPDRVRVPDGARTRLVAAEDVVVADNPQWLQLALPGVVPGPDALADVLGLELAREVYDGVRPEGGVETLVPSVVAQVLPELPRHYVEHDDLTVAGRPVDWWVDDAGDVHAATADGLARGLAWAAGRWGLRFVVAEVLRDPSAAPALLAEQTFDQPD